MPPPDHNSRLNWPANVQNLPQHFIFCSGRGPVSCYIADQPLYVHLKGSRVELLTGILLSTVVFIWPRSTISRNPDGVADCVHAPAGSVTSSIPLTSFDSPCAIVKESVLCACNSMYRSRVWFSNLRPHRGSKASFLVLFLGFSPGYLEGCLLRLARCITTEPSRSW